MSDVVFLFGNGLSIGFNQELELGRLSSRVWDRLQSSHELGINLQELLELASPDDVDKSLGGPRGNFEQIAGPLDRIAEVIVAVDRLVGKSRSEITKALYEASGELRVLYTQVVGTTLLEIDKCVGQLESEAWESMNTFASELHELHRSQRVKIFNLNYDTILMSALLNSLDSGCYVYDGFRGGNEINEHFDTWKNIALYHLHGSISWSFDRYGGVSKKQMSEIRADGTLQKWAMGDLSEGLPVLVLTDHKRRVVRSYPFSALYDRFSRDLEGASTVIVAGYSFGDFPVNLALSRYLAGDGGRRIRVWTPSAEADKSRILARLQRVLNDSDASGAKRRGRLLLEAQVKVKNISLPSAGIIQDLYKHGAAGCGK